MKVRAAAILLPGGRPQIRELDLEEPRDDEVLIKVAGSGLCHTDLWAREAGYAPVILGHETSGTVERCGAKVRGLAKGDRVAVTYTYCRRCAACKEKRIWECEEFSANFSGERPDGTTPFSYRGEPVAPFMRQGGFSEYTVVHKNAVVKIPAAILESGADIRLFGPLTCGMITGAGAVLNILRAARGTSIAAGGAGAVGLAALAAAKKSGCFPVIVIDRIQSRLDTAKELGADFVINTAAMSAEALTAELLRLSGGRPAGSGGLDFSFDSTGSDTVLDGLRRALKPGAKSCGVGIGGVMRLSAAERREGKTWEDGTQGHSYPPAMVKKLLSWYRREELPLEKIVKFYPLSRIAEAFAAAESGAVIKPVIVP